MPTESLIRKWSLVGGNKVQRIGTYSCLFSRQGSITQANQRKYLTRHGSIIMNYRLEVRIGWKKLTQYNPLMMV